MDSVFQCYIEFLPKNILFKKYGTFIPNFENKNPESQVLRPIHHEVFRDEISDVWNEYELKLEKILDDIRFFKLEVNSLFHKPENGSLFWGSLGENYCSIYFDSNTKNINFFQFGVCITEKTTKAFVENIMNLAIQNDFVCLGSDLIVFEPIFLELDKYFRNSPAYKFLKNRESFMNDVRLGKEKTDVPFFTIEE